MYKKIIGLVFFAFFIIFGSVNTYSKTHRVHTVTKLAQHKGKPSYYVFGKPYWVMKTGKYYQAKGTASWYGPHFNHRYTSSGERFNMFKMTAAHKTLPLSTYVLVTNLKNGRHVVVKINDRGPFVSNRLIDLSYAAAKKLGMVGAGIAQVSIKAISPTRLG